MAGYLSGIEFTREGYLLLPHHEAQGNGGHEDCKPLVLDSVEQLWLKFHPHCQEIHFVTTLAATDASVDSATHDANTTTESPATGSAQLSDLIRFRDMCNKVVPVLEDIDKMKDKQRFLVRVDREERNRRIRYAESQRHIAALEREQNAHQKHAAGGDSGGGGGGDANLEDDQEVTTDYSNETLRVVKTLNSLRLIGPILVQLLNHELQNDTSLTIGKESIAETKNRNSRGRRWMLGEYVYDIGSNKNFQSLRSKLRQIMRPLGTPDEIDDLMDGNVNWTEVLGRWYTKSQSPMPKLLELNEEQLENAMAHDAALKQYLQDQACDNGQSDLFANAVRRLKQKLDTVLQGRFRGCQLEVYGSCLSNLSIGVSSDVDISIHIPELKAAKDRFERGTMTAQKYDSILKRHVYCVRGRLQDFNKDFFDTEAVARARVPVVKGTYRFAENPHTKDGSLAFDICFFNDIAVRNSTLIRDYTEVSQTSKDLMMAVKKWAKDHRVCSSADQKLSSYAWMILVIHYLQQIGLLPNLQCTELMKKAGFEPGSDPTHTINALNTAFVPWEHVKQMNAWDSPPELAEVPVSVLLHGFFHYLASHLPSRLLAASIRTSAMTPKPLSNKCSLSFLCIEDPFETFDSHCPHELGSPADNKAQMEIMNLLEKAERQVHSVLMGEEGELWTRPIVKRCAAHVSDNGVEKAATAVDRQGEAAQKAPPSEIAHEMTTAAENSNTTNDVDKGEDQAVDKGEHVVETIQKEPSSGEKPGKTTTSKAQKSNGNKNSRYNRDRKVHDNRVTDQGPLARTNADEKHHKTTASPATKVEAMKRLSDGNLIRNKSRRMNVGEQTEKRVATALASTRDETTKRTSSSNLNRNKQSESTNVDNEHNEKVNKTASSENGGNASKAKAGGNRNRNRKPAPKGQKGITKVQLADNSQTLPMGGVEVAR